MMEKKKRKKKVRYGHTRKLRTHLGSVLRDLNQDGFFFSAVINNNNPHLM